MQVDRWLLPRRQTEFPARELVAEEKLHARREATFLALAAMFLVPLAALVVLGTARAIDLTALVAPLVPDVDLPAARVPLGAVPAALGFCAVMLACELYGRRRAAVLVVTGTVAAAALVAFALLSDALVVGDAFAPAVALASGLVVAHLASLLVFDAFRRALGGRQLALRVVLASCIAQPGGWAVFAAVTHAWTGADLDAVAPLALGAVACTFAATLVLVLPLAIAARVLSLYLRVGRSDDDALESRRLPPAQIVEDDDEPAFVPRRRAARASIQPFTSSEMAFFQEGDQLAD